MTMDELDLARFAGIARLYGMDNLRRFSRQHVVVVGVGGVGSWSVEALARSGVGQLTLIDLDDICISNSNRQLHTLGSTLGQTKVAVLRERVLEIAPNCQVHAVPDFLSAANAATLLGSQHDGIIDAIDNPRIKALIIARARQLGIPLVVSGSAGGRRDPLQLKWADLGHCGGDPLLAAVRRELKAGHPEVQPETQGNLLHWRVPCVFSTEKPQHPQPDGSCSLTPSPSHEPGLKLDCRAGFGACTALTGSVGFALASGLLQRLALSPA